ncbi:unnamed protein product, partial [Brachionus calyciflorus]
MFPGVKSKCCMFHFGQSVIKNLGKLDAQWEKCLDNQPANIPNLDNFFDYFVNYYFEGNFPKEMWNHYANNNLPITNNNLEGYNSKLKRYIVVSHPNIFAAVESLQKEEVST